MSNKPNLIAKILGAKKSAADEIQAAKRQIVQRQAEISTRLEAITDRGPMTGKPGHIRAQILLTGTPAEVVALDEEQRTLRAESQQLTAQAAELNKRLEQARVEQAKQDLPGAIKAVEPALKAWRDAQTKAEQAKAQLKAAANSVADCRALVGDDAPTVRHELALEVADALGMPERNAPDRYNSGRAWMVKRLSGELPEKARDGYDPRPERPDLSKSDGTDVARQPDQSIWDRKEPRRATDA